MTSFTTVDTHTDRLLLYLMALDQYQLEEFRLHLRPLGRSWKVPGVNIKQLSQARFPEIPWADLRAADPVNLFCLLNEHFPEWQLWEVVLSILGKMNLTSLCEQVREEMKRHVQTQEPQDPDKGDLEVLEGETDHRREFRKRLKTNILAMWDNIPCPEGHIYICNTSEDEHKEMQRLLDPSGTKAQAQTIVLQGRAGTGKTTLVLKAMLHWAEGILFQHRFSYIFYLSCLKTKYMQETTFADLLCWDDKPNSEALIEEFMSQPERLLFVVDGFQEMTIPEPGPYHLEDSPPRIGWHQKLPVTKILLSLLKKELVPLATLLITIRTPCVKDLTSFLVNPCFVHVTGFAEEDREVYFSSCLGNQKEAKAMLEQVRRNEALFNSCSAPMVCWTICSCLKQLKARSSDLQTTTSLYACFFSNLFSTADTGLPDESLPGQWNTLCALAAEGMWSLNFTFGEEDAQYQLLEVPFINSLFHLGILQAVSDHENCITFTHPSFQEFFAAMFYVLEEPRESVHSSSTKHGEMKIILRAVLVDQESYWAPMVLFFFGLLKKDLIRKLEDTLHCKMSPRIMEELLEWKEELDESETASVQFDTQQFFRFLHETQEEDFVKKMLGYIFEADVDILGSTELQVSSFCLKHCEKLHKLRLSVSRPIPESTGGSGTQQWKGICTAFVTNRYLSELDLSNSKLSISSMRSLCRALRNPRSKLQKLTCKSITPVSVLPKLDLVLRGNKKLTHLNLSSNRLDVGWIFKAVRYSACNIKCLCLERCNLSATSCPYLASLFVNVQNMTRLCLGLNELQDEGAELLCDALTQPNCTLKRLELWLCQLGAPSCRYLSDALLKNKSLTHLNLSRNQLGDEGVKFLSEALSYPDCSLRCLNLSGCSFTTEGCQELSDALKHNHNMHILDIGRNDLGDNGAKLLCEALKASSCSLNTLGLEKCNLTAACCQHLSSLLSSHKKLAELNLIGNDLEPDGVKTLCFRKTCIVQ
ncbi:NACHT, LRR and PYD domains-containing protein 13 [Nycticebus coucang]|uniref:NACHT, LRR and PYD domains-containing protein 13 n=1 Tax=Nycticebus coucang TaxID=9470 RepID=UPI00234C9B77|nr:NACHT, LRR and PYD domains-containing protein 13 [Nycticebus coucang]